MRKLVLIAAFLLALGGAMQTAQAGEEWLYQHTEKRVVGHGQIKFCARGLCAGPEKWAWHSRRQAQKIASLKAERLRLKAQLALMKEKLRSQRTTQVHETATAYPAHYSAWMCIHRYEGAWDANTGNGYYGGLQMDYGFQQTYGADLLAQKGTANNWTPLEQMQIAEIAYSSGRGFNPWPNTARWCGLL